MDVQSHVSSPSRLRRLFRSVVFVTCLFGPWLSLWLVVELLGIVTGLTAMLMTGVIGFPVGLASAVLLSALLFG